MRLKLLRESSAAADFIAIDMGKRNVDGYSIDVASIENFNDHVIANTVVITCGVQLHGDPGQLLFEYMKLQQRFEHR